MIRVVNLLLPLLVYPYLIDVLGKNKYGLVVYAEAIVGFFVILVGFGFNITGTKQVSVFRENKDKLGEIVSSIFIIKLVFFLISIVILFIVLNFIPEASNYKLLFYLTLWLCIYDIIFPVWYFQGIEQMKYITYITIVTRLVFFVLIFIFINKPSDYLYFPILNAIGAFTGGAISMYVLFIKHKINFILPTTKVLKYYILDSYPIFISNFSIKLYVSSNKVVVGVFLGMSGVAYYDLAEKVINMLKVPQNILNQSLFPKVSREKNVSFIKKAFKISWVLNTVLFILLLIFSKQIVFFLGGYKMFESIYLINLLGITLPIIAMSNIFGLYMLIPFGYNKIFSKIIVSSGIFYVAQILFVWKTIGFNLTNIAILTITTEIFVTVLTFWFTLKKNLWKKNMITL